MKKCPVCHGSKRIRLPLYHDLSPLVGEGCEDIVPFHRESYREYECPECTDNGVSEKVAILHNSQVAQSRVADPSYQDALRQAASRELAHEFLRRGYIRFSEAPRDSDSYFFRASLGVVSGSFVSSMQDRIKANQHEVAQTVTDRAIEKIMVWGSYYTGSEGSISKEQAVDAVKAALNETVNIVTDTK